MRETRVLILILLDIAGLIAKVERSVVLVVRQVLSEGW